MRVIKLGGSLLELPDLGPRLRRFVHQLNPPDCTLILVGGGAVVDAIRNYDNRWKLDEVPCHWLCVHLLNSTARLLHLLMPEWPLIMHPQTLTQWLASASRTEKPNHNRLPAIVAPDSFYSPTANAHSLPLSWETTSDSIAALLARITQADELILLKSTDPPSGHFVSSEFPKRVDGTSVYETPYARTTANQPAHHACVDDFVDNAFLSSLPPNLRVSVVNLRAWRSRDAL